jgi:uridine kinase
MTPFFIGIAGPSCSGKSEVSRRLSRILRAPVIALDHYYRDLKAIPFEERVKTNFDSPESLDHDLLLEHARRLKQGLAIEEPSYDFAHHVRTGVTVRIEPADFMILDGLFALHWPQIRQLLNARIYITADHDVCLERRIYRDVRERGRTEESVRLQYDATVRPMCDCYVVPSRMYADVVLSGTEPLKQSVRRLLDYIAGCLDDPAKRDAIRGSLSTWLASAESAEPAGIHQVT